MKNQNLWDMFGLIDDELLEEADPYRINPPKKVSSNRFYKIISIVICALLVLNIAIFVPLGIKLNKDGGLGAGGTGGAGGSGEQDKVIIECIQNVTNLQVGKPDGTKNTIKLSSPIVGTASEYEDLVKALEEISNGRISSLEYGSPEHPFKEEIKDENDSYVETTDNQVAGVIEGDLIKRSDKYIYYLSDDTVKIYSIEKNDSKIISVNNLEGYIEAIENALEIPKQGAGAKTVVEPLNGKSQCEEIFLSPDCKTISVVLKIRKYMSSDIYGNENIELDEVYIDYTVLLSLNVEDPENVYLNNVTTLVGEYKEMRLLNGEFVLFTKFTPRARELAVPQYNDGDGFVLFPLEKIEQPSQYTTESYTLAFRIDGGEYKVKDCKAYASYDGHIYVSGDNIYLTRSYYETVYYDKEAASPEVKYVLVEKPDGTKKYEAVISPIPDNWEQYDGKLYKKQERITDILKVSFKNGKLGTADVVTVSGYLKDRYSLSQNGDILYVVTSEQTHHSYRAGEMGTKTTVIDESASVYCIDINAMAQISSVEDFAPKGEKVMAVKFEGAHAYVCTATEKTDPVFYFDLTYPAKITYSDTGTIPGFSTSLIDYGNGKLLGIGQDENSNVKVEIYEKVGNQVKITDTYIIDGFTSTDYKAYYVNRELGLFGFGIWDYSRDQVSKYVMLQIKNGYISEVFNVSLRGDNSTKRAVYIDGYFYLVSEGDFTAKEKQVTK